MQIQIDTDDHIEGNERLAQEVETTVRDALDRFSDSQSSVPILDHLDRGFPAASSPGSTPVQ